MYYASNKFRNSMKQLLRERGHMKITIGIVNSFAQTHGTLTGDLLPYSNEPFIWGSKIANTDYATFEENQFKMDGSQYLLPSPSEGGAYNKDTGIVTEDFLGAVEVSFNQEYDLKGMTITFGDFYPTSFKITIDSTDYVYSNNSPIFETSDTFGLVREFTITPLTMVGGQQRFRIQNIVMGVGFTFSDDIISNYSATEEISFISNEISKHSFTLKVFDTDNIFDVDNSNSFINYFQTEQKIVSMVGLEIDDEGTIEWVQQGVFYLKDWGKQGMYLTLKGEDKLSFLTDYYNDGNTIHERTLYNDFVDLMQYIGLDSDEYDVDETLREITVVNPIPNVTVAQALQMIANAGRCICFQDRYGIINMVANYSLVLDPEDVIVTSTNAADYANAHNILVGATDVYADLTYNFFVADGSMKFIPPDGNGYLDNTGYVSAEISDLNGEFQTTPSITLELPAEFVYYGLYVNFVGNPPTEMIIETFNDNTPVANITVTDLQTTNYLRYTFRKFDKMVVSFTQTQPHSRINVTKLAFSDLSDYKLTFNDVVGDIQGVAEKKVKTVKVKKFTFEEPLEDGQSPQMINDEDYYDRSVSDTGTEVKCANQLIHTQAHAQLVAEWLANYYANNKSYSCNFRGDPTLNAADIIHVESNSISNLQASITKHTFTFNGAFGGSLEMRKAVRTD